MRIVGDAAGLDALRTDWERLGGEGIFQGWAWNRAWWRHYGHLGRLHVMVVERDERVVGIAPFYHARPRMLRLFRPATLRFVGTGGDTSPDDVDLLAEPAHAEAVAATVCARLYAEPGVRRLLLEHMPAGSRLLHALERRAAERGDRRLARTGEHRRVATLPASAEAWRGTLSRNSRKHLGRRRRRADEAGTIRYRRIVEAGELDDAFAALVRLHRARHAGRGDVPSFSSAAYNGFHRELMEALLVRGELVLVTLELDGRTVGVEYAFRHGATVAFFQAGIDPAAEALSPGHLLISHVIEAAIAEGARVADFLRGNHPYKASYADASRESVSLDGPTRRAPFSVVAFAARRRARLAGRVKPG